MSIILFIIILATLILVHELGHFIAAKRAGVRVDEFGIGFPPRIFSRKIGGTVYSINLFPVGGFVKIFGENGETINSEQLIINDEIKPEKVVGGQSLTTKSRLVQAWIIAAGIIFNLVFAWILISIGFIVGTPYSSNDSVYGAHVQNSKLVITHVLEKSPASLVGLNRGDRITTLSAGANILTVPTVETVQKFINENDDVVITYERGSEVQTIFIEPENGVVDGRRAIGISMDSIGILKLKFHEALYEGFITTSRFTLEMFVGILGFFNDIFTGSADFSNVAGPVGIVGVVRDTAAIGFMHLLSLTALISINLAVINFLPFPALDGGRLFFLAIEAIKRSPINPKIVNITNSIGFIFLILLMVVVTYHDILRL